MVLPQGRGFDMGGTGTATALYISSSRGLEPQCPGGNPMTFRHERFNYSAPLTVIGNITNETLNCKI